MGGWYVFSVFLHLLASAFWIGGMLFLPLVVLPGIRNNPERVNILFRTGMKFRFYGWIALVILVVTGFVNVFLRGFNINGDFFLQNAYGQLLGYKLMLFALVLLISAVHDFFIGKKALGQMQGISSDRFRLIARWSGRITLLLSLAMAWIGLMLSRGFV